MGHVLRHHGLAVRPRRIAGRKPRKEWPLWLTILALYSSLALIVCSVIALCFLFAWLATGSAI
jgi:hypothetical protein